MRGPGRLAGPPPEGRAAASRRRAARGMARSESWHSGWHGVATATQGFSWQTRARPAFFGAQRTTTRARSGADGCCVARPSSVQPPSRPGAVTLSTCPRGVAWPRSPAGRVAVAVYSRAACLDRPSRWAGAIIVFRWRLRFSVAGVIVRRWVRHGLKWTQSPQCPILHVVRGDGEDFDVDAPVAVGHLLDEDRGGGGPRDGAGSGEEKNRRPGADGT